MQWSKDKNAGFSESEPWISVPGHYEKINAETEIEDEDSIYSFYKKLITLRKEKTVISQGDIIFIEKENPNILAYKRIEQGQKVIVLADLPLPVVNQYFQNPN